MSRFAFIANNSYVPWGGSEELWAQTALRLQEQGHSVLACVQDWRPMPERIAALEKANVRLHVLRPRRFAAYRAGICRLLGRPDSTPAQIALSEILVPFAPDLITISQMMNLDGVGWASGCLKHGLPFALLSQAASDSNWPINGDFDSLVSTHRAARALFYVSEHNRRLTAEMLGMDFSNAQLVSNPFLVPYRSEASWPDSTTGFRLACVARLEPSAKGQDILLRVLATPKWRERPLAVTFFGHGPNARALEAMSRRLGLLRVHFAGHVTNIGAVWQEHHALILPSRAEGQALALIEGMLCDRLAIVTAGGNAELVEEGLSGFVAETPSVRDVDVAMERAWQRRTEWRELGLAAGRRIRVLVPPDPIAAFAVCLIAAARSPT